MKHHIELETRYLRRYDRHINVDDFGDFVKLYDIIDLLSHYGIALTLDTTLCPLLRNRRIETEIRSTGVSCGDYIDI